MDTWTENNYHRKVKAYYRYVKAVEETLKEYNTFAFSGTGDPFFSWRSCDCCGNTLAGNRREVIYYNDKTKEVECPINICDDCYYFAEYGELSDMDMLAIGEDSCNKSHADKLSPKLGQAGYGLIVKRRVGAFFEEHTWIKGDKEILVAIDRDEGTVTTVERV